MKLDLEVVTEIYKDLLSPSLKNIGKALGTGADTLNTLLLPLTFYNEKRRLIYAANIKRLQTDLDKIPEDTIIEIPSEITEPILERLSYVSNEHLAQLFHNLLINAASHDTMNIAHPGFISVIDRLSPDEAKILFYMKDMRGLPALSYKIRASNYSDTVIFNNETVIQNFVELNFPQNRNLYFENLISLGILKIIVDLPRSNKWLDKYAEIEENYLDHSRKVIDALKGFNATDISPIYEKAFFDITDFGRMFIKACIKLGDKKL